MVYKPKKIFQFISLVFLIESFLLLLGLHFDFFSFGPDLSTHFMVVLIVFMTMVVFFMNMFLLERKLGPKQSVIYAVFLLGLGWFYLNEIILLN